jgi:hypothetical protein
MICLIQLDLPLPFWQLDLQIGLPNHFAGPRFGKSVCQTDLAFRFVSWFAKPICILLDLDLAKKIAKPDLDLATWFAKWIWQLDLQIGLPNQFAGPTFGKLVWFNKPFCHVYHHQQQHQKHHQRQ